MPFNPNDFFVGGFTPNDGTIDFYLRVKSLINDDDIVLDFGAGRGAWFDDDKNPTRRDIRLLKGKVKKVIAADIDKAVFNNKASDEQIIITKNKLDIEKESIDLVISDYVLEHINDTSNFFEQINFCLKSGGWLCGRTPYKYSYVSIGNSIFDFLGINGLIKYIQPDRKEEDIFPTEYKLNTLKDINKCFKGWDNRSFIFRAEPAYYFNNKLIYSIQKFLHRLFPSFLCGNIFLFIQKPTKKNTSDNLEKNIT